MRLSGARGGRRARGLPLVGLPFVGLAVVGLTVVGLVAGLLGAAVPALGATAPALKAVSFGGYRFEVPSSWPVISLASHPTACVRFDLHAVYVGEPGADQHCPSWLLGATESILIRPAAADARRKSREDPVADEITASAPGLAITATFDSDPGVIDRILASAGLPAPVITAPNPVPETAKTGASKKTASGNAASGGTQQDQVTAVAPAPAPLSQALSMSASLVGNSLRAPMLPNTVANDVGLGFDTCAAPSASYMRTWRRRSRYRAVGIYIGGSDRTCFQQNLSLAWVREQAADGWRFIPMYAGPQAEYGQLSAPAQQGRAAADDAVLQAERLGFGPLTPLYYDMEAYPAGESDRVLRFVSAWTAQVHRLGYLSGVYSSSDAAIADLARQYRTGQFAMPDVIYDALWNGQANTADSVFSRGEWTGGRRIHQFSGNVLQTYGGDTLLIDQDYLDISLTAAGGTLQASPGVTNRAGLATLYYEGADHHLWQESGQARRRWSLTDLGGDLTSQPSVVQLSSGQVDVFYRGRGDVLWELSAAGTRRQRAIALTQMRQVGAPHAVAQPNGVIDVFWHGTHDEHLWHAQYSPAQGWRGPQSLGGRLRTDPYPVETTTGQVQVFWKGQYGHLWRVVRNIGGRWGAPQDLGMRTLGGSPIAVALPSGEVDVFWRGTAPHAIWSAVLRPGVRPVGPTRLGGVSSGLPWPVIAAGSEYLFLREPDGALWVLQREPDGRWSGPVRVARASGLLSTPFSVAGSSTTGLQVFWIGRRGRLWTERLAKPGGWESPQNLGGRL
jgi:hypothetical protein